MDISAKCYIFQAFIFCHTFIWAQWQPHKGLQWDQCIWRACPIATCIALHRTAVLQQAVSGKCISSREEPTEQQLHAVCTLSLGDILLKVKLLHVTCTAAEIAALRWSEAACSSGRDFCGHADCCLHRHA